MKYTFAKDSNGTAYPLFGVSAELARWLWEQLDAEGSGDAPTRNGDLVRSCLVQASTYKDGKGEDGIKRLKDKLLVILGGSLGHDFQAAEEFLYEHWHAHIELGPYPCPHLLAEFQSLGVFYSEYRDHVAHQLKVYLLGLYVFCSCTLVQRAVLKEIEDEYTLRGRTATQPDLLDAFRIRWAAAALPHDVGYVVEEGASDPESKIWSKFKQEFQKILEQPLAGQFGLWRDEKVFENLGDDTRAALSEKMPILRRLNRAVRVSALQMPGGCQILPTGNALHAEPIITGRNVSCCGHKPCDTNFRML